MRAIDRLDTAPRFSEHDAIRLNRMFRGSETDEWVSAVLRDGLAGDVAIVSSFGAESAALLHLVSRIDPSVPVLFLDTGKHFPETLAYRDELADRFGLNLVNLYPDLDDLKTRDETGLRWSYDPDGCCELRKVRPLAKALATYDASLTGRKAFQSSTRANLPRIEIDTSDEQGRLKINPLIDWDADRIAAYFNEHDLPRHPLVERGFPSIGCSPCTRPVGEGEDPRAGRWAGWDKVECGIHKPGEEPFL
ncbi:MAG: phosphoadenylyl-sulfate reductase [Altererythrobacter sp.]|nr:phosphoadenylyl-sulfate reductase [Altererythrobacter sp.]MBK63803.1 phosphoadenylyl-sulfate reductase [Altererythrobacter sp.]